MKGQTGWAVLDDLVLEVGGNCLCVCGCSGFHSTGLSQLCKTVGNGALNPEDRITDTSPPHL